MHVKINRTCVNVSIKLLLDLSDRRERRHAGASAAVAAAVTAICINMVLDAVFCGSRATVCMSGGLEMRKVSLSGGRAGRVMIFLARSILARGHPDRIRYAIMGTMETDIGAQTIWLLESMHLGGGGGVGRWRR